MSQASVSDESMSNEEMKALGEEIATFAAKLDVATHALITRLRRFDANEGWAQDDFVTCAHWLSWRTGIGLNAAREKVRVARALAELPRIDALFGKGELSFSKVRAITRVATPASEQDFIDIAMNATASQVERLCQAYRRTHEDKDASMPKPRRYVRRSKTLRGMTRIEMQLPPEEAEVVWDALMSAMDAGDAAGKRTGEASNLDGTKRDTDAPAEAGDAEPATDVEPTMQDGRAATAEITAVTREPMTLRGRTDVAAVVRPPVAGAVADVTAVTREPDVGNDLASTDRGVHDDGCCAGAPVLPANDGEAQEEARADAMVEMARAYLRLRPRTLGSGYDLVMITTQERLEAGANEVGAVMRDGTPLPLEVARMLACDSARVNVTADRTGALLDVGRSTRTIPPAIARALWLRDGGCRVPGCGRRRHLQAHHIIHWVDGGPTCLSNLLLVCSRHHKAIHEGRISVEIRDGKLVFRDAQGRERPAAPSPATTGEELEALERFLREADLHIDPSLTEPRWDGTRLDLDEALAWMSVADQTRPATPG
jgi:hypothetical protein